MKSYLVSKTLLMLCVFSIFGCRCESTESISTLRAISYTMRQGAETILEMKTVADFEWDRLFVFEPYTLRKTIHEVTGLSFLKENEVRISVEESKCLLVFVKSGNVATYFTYPRSKGDFSDLAKKKDGFSPDEAVFKVAYGSLSLFGRVKKVEWLEL